MNEQYSDINVILAPAFSPYDNIGQSKFDMRKSYPAFRNSPAEEIPDERLVKLLGTLGLEKYIETFLSEEWDWDALMEITSSDLMSMGLKSGSRRKLIAAIQRVRGGNSTNSLEMPSSPTIPQVTKETCNYIIDYSEITKKNYLGKGFYGEVFLGSWNGIDVAIKQMNQPLSCSLEKWRLEIELLQYVLLQ